MTQGWKGHTQSHVHRLGLTGYSTGCKVSDMIAHVTRKIKVTVIKTQLEFTIKANPPTKSQLNELPWLRVIFKISL